MNVDEPYRGHPLSYPCKRCGAKPLEHCKSANGRTIKGWDRIHAIRFVEANKWMHGN